jgi:hypothetical protein
VRSLKRSKSRSAAVSPTGPTVAEIIKRQRMTIRRLLDEWQTAMGFSIEHRRIFLNQQRNKIHRRALRCAKRGDDLEARSILGAGELLLQRMQKYPREAVMGAKIALAVEPEIQNYLQRLKSLDDLPEDALAALKRLNSVSNLFARMSTVSKISSQAQSDRASKLRPKKEPTQRSITISAMRASRAEGRSFEEFLDAVQNGGVDSVRVSRAGPVRLKRYDIECDAPAGNTVSQRTLHEWWTEAGKRITG